MNPLLTNAARGLSFAPQSLSSDALREKLTDFNRRAGSALDLLREANERVSVALAGVGEEGDSTDVFGATASAEVVTLDTAQRLCELWRERATLAEESAADLAGNIAPAAEKVAQLRQSTAEVLDTVGLSPAAMIAGGWNAAGHVDHAAAERQFSLIVNQAIPVREAAQHADNAKKQHAAAVAAISASRTGLETAKAAAKKLASKAAAVAVA